MLTTARSAPQSTAEAVEERARDLEAWLKENAPYCSDEQQHLDAGSKEQAYWHHGYMMALQDVLGMLGGKKRSLN